MTTRETDRFRVQASIDDISRDGVWSGRITVTDKSTGEVQTLPFRERDKGVLAEKLDQYQSDLISLDENADLVDIFCKGE